MRDPDDTANERILNESLRTAEDQYLQMKAEVARLNRKGTSEYQALVQEAQALQSQLNNIAGRELVMQNNLKTLEAENLRLNSEISNARERELDYNNQISLLNQKNNNLIRQIESTQKMRLRLRNDIIGVIDQNDQVEPSRYRQ